MRVYICALCITAASACGRTQQVETPIADVQVTMPRPDAAIGMPLDMHYRFTVAPNAPKLNAGETVFVHFVDADGELMWTDDHQPPVPMSRWKPGQVIEYTRSMFVPKFPYSGDTRVLVGIYSPESGERRALTGETAGQHEYAVAHFNLHPQPAIDVHQLADLLVGDRLGGQHHAASPALPMCINASSRRVPRGAYPNDPPT